MIRTCDVGNVAILGASEAESAFLPPYLLPSIVRNYALPGTTPIEAYYESVRLHNCPKPPKTFVISFSAWDFEQVEKFWSQSPRFDIVNFDELQDLAKSTHTLHDMELYHSEFGSEPPPTMKNWLYAMHFPPYDFASLLASRISGRQRQNNKLTAEALSNGGQHVLNDGKCAEAPAWEATQTSFHAQKLNSFYFERLISSLELHNDKIILISPPITSLTSKSLRPSYVTAYKSFIDGVVLRHSNVERLGPLFPTMEPCLFSDQIHTNKVGAETFSRRVGPMISGALAH